MRYSHGSLIFKDSQLEKGQPFGDALRLHAKLDREEKELLATMTDDYTVRRHKRQELFEEKTLRKLDHLERRMSQLMTNVQEVTAAVETLTTDLEGLASAAVAEFAKLEQELSEQPTPVEVDLEPLKNSIDALDAKTKSAAGDIPTN